MEAALDVPGFRSDLFHRFSWLDSVADRVGDLFRRRRPELPLLPANIRQPEMANHYYFSKLLEFIYIPNEIVAGTYYVHNKAHRYTITLELRNDLEGIIHYRCLTAEVISRANSIDVMNNIRYLLLEKKRDIYKVLFEKIERFQRSWSFIEKKYDDLFPKCIVAEYMTIDEEAHGLDIHHAAIGVMTEVCSGYVLNPCRVADAELIVKHLALLHAVPIAMSLQLHGENILPGIESMLQQLPPQYVDVETEYERIRYALRNEPYFNLNNKKIYEQLQLYFANSYTRQTDSPWTTVCYSRCSMRKIMLQRSTENNAFPDPKFVTLDYLHVDSCTSDLIFFLLTSADQQVLMNNIAMNHLVTTYFHEFRKIMVHYYIDHPAFASLPDFVTNCGKSAVIHLGHIFCEIGRLYYDGIRGENEMNGGIYNQRIIAAYRTIEAMLTLSFI